jgi:hydrogenase small subunit
MISLRYQELLMGASGKEAEQELLEAVSAGEYLLVVEGCVPASDDRFCLISGKPFSRLLEEASKRAVHIIACGACASYGGIPKAGPTGSTGMSGFLNRSDVVNLPTCPVHPDHLVATIMHFLYYGYMPELDKFGRPEIFFKSTVHDSCERRVHFERSEFLKDWNDPLQKEWCLYLKGCKGTVAFADCSLRKWNGGMNWCVECGAGCQGCSEPGFYEEMSPLFERLEEDFNADKIGAAVGLAASAGLAAHFIRRSLSVKRRKKEDGDAGDRSWEKE